MSKDILQGSTNKALISMSLPISIGMLSTILFQVIDTYFVGKLGPDQLAALGFASTVYFILIGLFIGLAVGVSIIVGRTYGAGEIPKVKRIILIALTLSFLITSFLSLIGYYSIESLFTLIGAGPEVLVHIDAYMSPLYMGMPILVIGIVSGSALRATGNIKLPEIVFGIAGIINAVLDYAFIFGTGPFPELGIQGVALGTVISWVFILIAMIILMLRDRLISLSFVGNGIKNLPILQEIYKLGVPSILTQLVGPATLMYITFLLGQESETAVAAFGVAGRIETLMLIGVMGISSAATPFIAQNLGAKQHVKIDEAVVFGGKAATYLGLLLFVFLMIFIGPIATLFSESQEIIGYTKQYFYLVSISYVFYSLYLITSSIFNGLQLPVNSLKIILVKALAFTVPLTLIGSFWGIEGIFVGISLGNVMGGIYAGIEMRKQLKKVNSPLIHRNPLKDYRSDLALVGRAISSMFKREKPQH